MTVKAMRLCLKVAELNTHRLEKALQAYLVCFFNEMQNTNENTNLCKLADAKEQLLSGTSQQKRCQSDSNHC